MITPLDRLKLKTRITLSLGILGIIFIIVMGMIYNVVNETTLSFHTVSKLKEKALKEVKISKRVDLIQHHVLRFVYRGDDFSKQEVKRLYSKLRTELEELKADDDSQIDSIMLHLDKYYTVFLEVIQQRDKSDEIIQNKYHHTSKKIELLLLKHAKKRIKSQIGFTELFTYTLLTDQHLSHYFSTLDGSALKKAHKYTDITNTRLEKLFKTYKDTDIYPELLKIDSFIKSYHHAYNTAIQTTQAYLYLVNVVMSAEAYEVIYLMNKRNMAKVDKLNENEKSIIEKTESLHNNLLWISISLVSLAILINFFISRSITKPINNLALLFNKLSSGDFSTKVKAYNIEDEIGELTHAAEIFRIKNKELYDKASALEESNRYKSQFLANMSHELRTPLNSINILSEILAKNSKNNLNEDQVAQAEVINTAGNDLLELINDILDLSKIEANMMSLNLGYTKAKDLAEQLRKIFTPIVEEKKIRLIKDVANDIDTTLYSDSIKVMQIMRNFISNAIKFTPREGEIQIRIAQSEDPAYALALSVADSGIGVPLDKQESIFNSFVQVDGSTSRKYGGTGLGLAISNELAKMLQGKITLTSSPNEGSTFTLLLPRAIETHAIDQNLIEFLESGESLPEDNISTPLPAQRQEIVYPQESILIIDDDKTFGDLVKNEVESLGFHAVYASSGEEGLCIARESAPAGIILDRYLPGTSGIDVLRALKTDERTKNIPVKVISCDPPDLTIKHIGAIDCIQKPVSIEELHKTIRQLSALIDTKMKNVLLIEDDSKLIQSLKQLLYSEFQGIKVFMALNATEALASVKELSYDLIIADLGLPDMKGLELLQRLKEINENFPIIVYSGKQFDDQELAVLEKYSDFIIPKAANSHSRLIQESANFLNTLNEVSHIQPEQEQSTQASLPKDIHLKEKNILIVDDDVRNVFAFSALLEAYESAHIETAFNGKEAIEIMQEKPFDLVFMDIMMPVMDGYEAIAWIKTSKEIKQMPVIIALTAKAQEEDEQKCLDAGADFYLSKPVDSVAFEKTLFKALKY